MFGFGASKAKSSSRTNVEDISGSSGQSQFDQGYDSTGGTTQANAYDSGSTFGQDVWGPQAGALGGYYGDMSQLWQQFMGQGGGQSQINAAAGQASPFMSGIAGAGAGGMQQLISGGAMGGAGQGINPALLESLTSSLSGPSATGRMYQDIVGGPGNTFADPLINRMRADTAERQGIQDMYGKLDAGGMGQQGSSRQGVADFLRSKDLNVQQGNREASTRYDTYDKDLDWKMKIAEQADLGKAGAQERAIGLLSGGDRNTAMGVQAGGATQNLGMGMMAPWMQASQNPFQMGGAYGNMLGGPTVLGQGSQFGTGSSEMDQFYSDTGFGSGSSDYEAFREYQASQRNKSSALSASGSVG